MLSLHVCHDCIVELLRLHDVFEFTLDSVGLRPLHGHRLAQLHHSHRSVHVSISVTADSSSNSIDKRTVAIRHLHLLKRDVLATLELDEVLLAVHNSKASIRHELANITSVEPAILSIFFLRLIGHHVVSDRDIVSTNYNFTTTVDWVAFNVELVSR